MQSLTRPFTAVDAGKEIKQEESLKRQISLSGCIGLFHWKERPNPPAGDLTPRKNPLIPDPLFTVGYLSIL